MSGAEPEESVKDIEIEIVELVKTGKRSYIYKCTKPQLKQILEKENIQYSQDASIDTLRKLLSDFYKTKTVLSTAAAPKMSICGDIKPFDGDRWQVFLQQLECFIIINDIADEKQTPLLITRLSPKVFECLTCLCSPDKPVNLPFKYLCAKLATKYDKPLSTTLERVEFRKRNQGPNESIQDYVLELRKLASRCQFKDQEDQIKEKFMDGVYSKLIRYELMKAEADLPLEKCIYIGRTVEAAMSHTNGSASNRVENVFYQKKKYPPYPNQQKAKCYCCGKNNHLKKDCTLAKKYCSECGKQGHIFRMCTKNQNIKILEAQQTVTECDQRETSDAESDVKKLFDEDCKTYSVSVSRVPPHYIQIKVKGSTLNFELDTGSDVTVMSLEDKNKYFSSFDIQQCNVTFKNFDQTLSRPLGIITGIPVQYKNLRKKLNIFVVKNNAPRVMGRDWLSQLQLWPPPINAEFYIGNNVLKNVSDAQQLIKEKFAAVFSPGWGNFKGDEISLKLKPNSKPKCLPVRRVPFALREKVNNEINRLLKNGRITPVEHNEWGTPVVPILKADGSVRLCGDYKLTVNQCLEIDHFPLPHVDDILNTLKHGEYYCELDLKEAYLQAPLSLDSQSCTTIVTESGTYMYKFLPYGVSSGPGAFQRLMMKKLIGIPNTIVFIDNIYIKGKSMQDAFETLCQVLQKLQECEFKLKPEKCKLFTTSLDVFGFSVNKNGISVIKSNIEPILNACPPTSMTLLKSFLGKVNYYARFLENMATVLTPLYDCTKKNKFEWSVKCDEAFNLIKKKLANVSNLKHYDPKLPLILTCDASETGLAAVLSNRDNNGVVKPIAYASKKLNDVEQRYTTIDKEALAVIFGITKFYNYVYGRFFELETDNAALVRIFGPTKSIPKMAAKRLQHYAIFLSAFNYKVRHIKSISNPADFLSRTVINKNKEVNEHYVDTSHDFSMTCYTNNSEYNLINWKKIQQETKIDGTLSKIIRYLMDGWPDKKSLDKEILPLYNRKNELTLDMGCLFWGYRILVPYTMREAVLSELHRSHFGVVRMKEIARSYFWWPNIDSEIENIPKQCVVCLRNSKTPTQTMKPWPVPPSTWYRIHADFLGPFYNKMFLVIVDSYSKWPEVFEMSNITSSRTIDVFKKLFTTFGYPVHLVTDNGPTFASQEFSDFCKSNQIKHTFTPPYHPATNGAAERFVETFKSAATKIKESGHSLVSAINLFLFDYRSTPQRTTGVSPARLMLGREIRNRFSLLRPPPVAEVAQEKAKTWHQGNRDVGFEVGQKVMVKDYRKGAKPWVQGLIIGESIAGVSYIIDVEGLRWKRHINQMLPCSQSLE